MTPNDDAVDWVPMIDPETGESFYLNEETGETTWEI
jgi:hypothetical protein